MDGDRQGKQVLCSLQLDKQDKHATANKMVKEEKKTKDKRTKQGHSTKPQEEINNKVTEMLSLLMTNLPIENVDAVINENRGNLVKCDFCARNIQNIMAPEKFKELHNLYHHVHSDVKFKK